MIGRCDKTPEAELKTEMFTGSDQDGWMDEKCVDQRELRVCGLETRLEGEHRRSMDVVKDMQRLRWRHDPL